MKKASAVACVSMLLMSCNGIDEAGPLPTVAPPPTSKAPTTAASTTTSTTSTSTTSTSTTTTSTTILEPIVSEVPPTDPERVDVQAVGADAFAGYEAGWQAFHDAAGDPSNEELRQRVAMLHIGDSLAGAIRVLDSLVADSIAEVTPGGRMSNVELINVLFVAGAFVSLEICEVLIDPVVDVVTDEIVFDEVVASTKEIRMNREDGLWKVASEITSTRWGGQECA